MGYSKKRSLDSLEEDMDQVTTTIGEVSNKDKQIPVEEGNSNSTMKPMERMKKRKELMKEKKRLEIQNADPLKTIQPTSTQPMPTLKSSSGLPQLRLNIFRDLSSTHSSARESAAESLMLELIEVQKVYESEGAIFDNESSQLDDDRDDDLRNCAPSLRYAVRRLIRGVSSSRECARQGFALGLTVVIASISSIRVEAVVKLIGQLLEVSASTKGQEARDCFLGQLFAYGAIVRSGRVVAECNSDCQNTVKEITNLIISLGIRKRYLQEPAVLIILDLVDKLPVEAVLTQVLESRRMSEWFESSASTGNADALLLALRIREKISSDHEILRKILPCPFSSHNFFSSSNLSTLAGCFQDSTFCQPRLHSLWPVLINMLLPDSSMQEDLSMGLAVKKHKKHSKSNASDEDNAENLHNFFEVVIEGCLLLSSHDRKRLAFDLIILILPRLPSTSIHLVFSNKLVHCLMDILSNRDSLLYKAGQYFVKELTNWIGNDDGRRGTLIVALQKYGGGRFDSITRTHTVKELVSQFKTGSDCMVFVQNLMDMFVNDGQSTDEPSDQSQTTDENSEMGSAEDKDSLLLSGNSDSLKHWIVNSFPQILKNLRVDIESRIRLQKEVTKFLAVQGLFSASLGTEVTSFELQEKFRWPKVASSSALCKVCIEQLQMLLAESQKVEGSGNTSHGCQTSDMGSYFMHFFSTLSSIPSVSLFRNLSSEEEKACKKLQAMETRLRQEERNSGPGIESNRVQAMRYLLIQLLLQMLLKPGQYVEAASELVMCCKKAFGVPTLLDSSEEEDEFDGSGIPELMDVLLDTLLSLLPQSSSSTCSAVEQVFKFFCDEITETGLLRMLCVIKKKLKPSRHQSMDDEEDEDILSIEEEEVDEEAQGDETETADSDATMEISRKLLFENTREINASDDSDSGLDDEAMFRMDHYLAQMLKERNGAPGNDNTHAQLVSFKLRVLSLLEIYLNWNPGKPQVLTIYSYLSQAFLNCHMGEENKQLEQRLGALIQKKIFKAKEYPKGKNIPFSSLESLLEKSLKLTSRTRNKRLKSNVPKEQFKMVASFAQNSVFWVLKIIQSITLSKKELRKVVIIFQNILTDYFESRKSRLKPGFIKEVFHRHAWIGQHLIDFLLEKCGNAKSEYRRIESLDLIVTILKSWVPSKGDNDNTKDLEVVKGHLPLLCHLIHQLVTKALEKHSRHTEVRRFCAKTIQVISTLNLMETFRQAFKPDEYSACESHIGDLFLAPKNV